MWLLLTTALAAEPTFSVGSYGRANISTDLEGGRAESFNIARYGPRLEKDPYVELDLGWAIEPDEGDRFDVLVTPALSGDLFHYDGQFDDLIALRNLYAQGQETIGQVALGLWAGSRMYRGDDVYLLDFWPLDEQNTWGGGTFVRGGHTEVALHAGVNRLAGDEVQVQTLTVTTPGGIAGQEVLVLDRQRTVATARVAQELPIGEDVVVRARLYGELHRLPAGQRAIEDPFQPPSFEPLPDDRGALIGAQLSAWGWAEQSFAHVWLRRETGLAAFDELSLPVTGLGQDRRAASARAWQLAWAGNHELGPAGVMVGGYWRDFTDADGQEFDFDDRTELVMVFRPQAYPTERTAIGVELSQQEVRPRGVNPRTDALVDPSVTKFSILPAFQVSRGGYSRPRIQLIYTATWLDDDARSLYDRRDVRVRGDGAQHFVGIGAEWWIASRGRTFAPEPEPESESGAEAVE